MPKPIVGILSPGDMGHTVGEVLVAHGLQVVTCLKDRSERTRCLARQACFKDTPGYPELIEEVDLILSILVPANAMACAQGVAEAIRVTGKEILYADCNAISPETVRGIGQVIQSAGGRFVDASIVGPPPRNPGLTRFYASGKHAPVLAQLAQYGLEIIVLGEEIGQASALKMCYASSTKGFTALLAEVMVGAEALGIREALLKEFAISQPELVNRIQRSLCAVPAVSRRFVGEMEEIASTYQSAGLTPFIFQGAAEMYRLIGSTTLAGRAPEDPNLPDLDTVLRILVQSLPTMSSDEDANR